MKTALKLTAKILVSIYQSISFALYDGKALHICY